MERIKIELPAAWAYETRLRVRIGDINYGQHLGNDATLALLQEARLRWLAQQGWSEKNVGGCGLIMADAAVVYKNQAVYGDELAVSIAATGVDRMAFDLVYRMTRLSDGAEIVHAKTGMVCFDYERNRPARMPDAFRAWIAPPA